MDNTENKSDFLFYSGSDGKVRVQIILGDETVWANQKTIAEIFGVESNTITYHIGEIYKTAELQPDTTTRKIRVVQTEGSRNIERNIDFYNLDIIIAVGYRVNSFQATQFRIWATKVLKEYLIKGFSLDDERLKQGNNLFNKDYFSELLERIREIRASERLFYRKVTDLYAESIDYDVDAPITKIFYSTVQNKLHWAIHKHTAAELICERVNAGKPHMGLTSWKNAPKGGKIIKTDVVIAKNYLNKTEIDGLNRLVNMYLDYAENLVKRGVVLKMQDWADRLDLFLKFNEYELLNDPGKVTHEIAVKLAEDQYSKFRVIQDKEFKSDFDKTLEAVNASGTLPKETIISNPAMSLSEAKRLSEFNRNLKKALDYNPKENKSE